MKFPDQYSVQSGRDAGHPNCSYTSFTHVQCRMEEAHPGSSKLAKKCQRLKKRFRDCGRGQEEIETSLEEYTDHNVNSQDTSSLTPFSREGESETQGCTVAPVSADVGDTLQEFMRYAEALKQKRFESSMQQGRALHSSKISGLEEIASEPMYVPWYARLFHRQAQCSPGRQRPWEKYKDDFKEV